MSMPPLPDSFIVPTGYQQKTAMAFVADSIRSGILSGMIPEGTQLRQDELAAKFGVSRMPVRDAIRQLEAEGLVTSEPHKGAFVSIMTIDDVVEIYDMRIMAETTALDLGFSDISNDDILEMEQRIHAINTARNQHALGELNEQFHYFLYARSSRPRLLALIKSLHRAVDRHLRFLLTNLDYHQKSQDDHIAILAACRAGDRELAKRILRLHLEAGRDEIVKFLRRK
ncbi:GntR family transcriptional regulator [Pseudomonas sp. SGAir0191]|nr:GntR family transcriptional regulator [Pseudomonas sp. SGAir0191]